MITYQRAAGITLNHANRRARALGTTTSCPRTKSVAVAILALFFAVGAFAQPIIFNEVMADNKTAYEFKGLFPDWVELYNTSPVNDLSLDGWSLTDDAAFPRKYVFPAGTRIDRQKYLVVHCVIAPLISEPSDLLTGFGLSDKGETLYLFDNVNTNTPHTTFTFGPQVADLSIARIPDVTGPFALAMPTPLGPNLNEVALGSPAPLKINEWLAAPPSGPDWFELYNPSALPVLVSGLYLSDRTNTASGLTNRAIPALSFIAALGYLKFDADDNLAQGADHVDFKLSTSGDRIVLFATNKTTVIDRVDFGAQTTGVSMGRLPDGGTNIIFMPGQTPSAPNFGPITSIVISEVLTHTDPPLEDAIELHNITASPVDISNWWISDEEKTPLKFRVPAGTVIPAGGFKVFYEGVGAAVGFNTSGTALEPDFSLSSSKGDDVWLFTGDAAGNLTGYRRSIDFGPSQNGVSFGRVATTDGTDIAPMSARTFGMDAPATVEQFRTGTGKTNAYPRVGPVVINEIMYNPPQLDEVLENTLDEFIELYNITDAAVPLFDPAYPTNTWRIRGGPEFNFPTNVTMPPKGFVLVVNFDPATNATQLAAFRALYGVPMNVPIFGGYKSKLNNNSDNVELLQPDTPQGVAAAEPGLVPYFLVEKVKYKDVAPWTEEADGTGLSLQRSPAIRYSNEATNWFAAPPTASRTNRPAAAPVIATIAPKTVIEGSPLTFTASATDIDLPPQLLIFSLGSGAPSGADISTAGVFSWTPTEAQGPSTNNVRVIVTDTGLPPLSATQVVTIIVQETNAAPVVAAITPKTVNEGALVSFTASATDSDVPAQTRTFSLGAGAPSGASISAAGNFTWTPSEAQGPGNYDILVIATDNGSPPLSATQAVNIVVNELNSAPALTTISSRTVNEGSLLSFTAIGVDGDLPAQTLSYTLGTGAPSGAAITVAGQFTWTPNEAQGPGNYNVVIIVADNGTPSLSATQVVNITVNEANNAPALTAIAPQTVNEGALLSFTATGSDSDTPVQTLSFSLGVGAPSGSSMSAAGAFTWTPTEGQGPGNYNVLVIATDNGVPSLSATQVVSITVNESNSVPLLAPITPQTVNEGALVSFNALAADIDRPVQTLSFTLGAGAPTGAAITANGSFTWTPTEAQGPGNYNILVIVSDNGSPSLSETQVVNIVVNELNSAPALAAIAPKAVNEGALLSFTATGTDSDLPAQTLSFTLGTGAPSGAAMTADGHFTWTPTGAQGPNSYNISIIATDSGSPPLSATQVVNIVVNETNSTPVLAAIASQTVNEGALLSFTATATDSDMPAQTLSFTLGAGAPAGAAITADGHFAWTPTEAQGPNSYNVFVIVTDNGSSFLSATQIVNIVVNESNSAPVLATVTPQIANEDALVSFTVSGTDNDLPAQTLSFSLGAGAPSGASISIDGNFTWTPTEAQGPNSYNVLVIATDNGSPSLSATQVVSIVVNESNTAPIFTATSPQSIAAGKVFNYTLVATDADVPAQTLTYAVVSGTPDGATFNATNGQFTWTPAADTPPGTNQIVFRVNDDGVPSLSATQTLTLVVATASLPHITSVTRETDSIRLEWTAVSGQRYQVLWAESITGPWIELGPPVTASGDTAVALDPAGEDQIRFYRLRVEP